MQSLKAGYNDWAVVVAETKVVPVLTFQTKSVQEKCLFCHLSVIDRFFK